MKRFIWFVALFMTFVSLFSALVAADDFSNDVFINVLDYGTSDNGGNYIFTANAGTFEFTYTLPFRTTLSYVDMVINIAAGVVPDINVVSGSGSYSLTRISLGNNMYRYYGSVRYETYSVLTLRYTVSASTYFSITKFDALTSRSTHFLETGYMRVNGGHLANTYSETMSSASDVLTCSFPYSSESDRSFNAQFSCPDWRNYDYIDFDISGFGLSLNSIYASVNGIEIPLSLSFVDGSSGGANSVIYRFIARLDLRGLDRTSTYTPTLGVRAFPRNTIDISGSYIQLNSVNGFVVSDSMDPYNYWLRTIEASISSGFSSLQTWHESLKTLLTNKLDIINMRLNSMSASIIASIDTAGINIVDKLTDFQTSVVTWFDTVSDQLYQLLHPDTSQSDQFQDDVSSQVTEFEDISSEIDNVTKPPVSDLDPSVDDIVSQADIANYTSILGILLSNPIFLPVCIMSLTFALVSYTIYGKR